MKKKQPRPSPRQTIDVRRVFILLIPVVLALFILNDVRLAFTAPAVFALPLAPVINEPELDGQIVSPSDVHMETDPMNDPDGHNHQCSDWQIIISATMELVWETICIGGVERVHTHLGDGIFQGSHAGQTELLHDLDYILQVRHIDDNGEISPWSQRYFRTGPATQIFPLQLDDILDTPPPLWQDTTGVPITLPVGIPQPFVRVESAAGQNLLQFSGFNGAVNNIINSAPLPAHENVRLRIFAGDTGSNLILPETDLTFVDDQGTTHTIYLPSMNITPTQTLYFWVSATGATYVGSAAQTNPVFSTLARGGPVPWNVLQTGYKVEVVASGFQLPVHIAFAPEGLYPGNPGDPNYYVTELYGKIKVVTRDGNVFDYATDLLNFNPTGNFPGSGEQGVAGIAVDPVSGDVFASMMYSTDPSDEAAPHYPKVMRYQSSDGGISASTQITILNMVGESQGQSHQISKLTIGPDGKLYVHMGDGFDASTALNLNSFRGKILRLNLDGSAPNDNPFYVGGGGAIDYVYAYGVRNPFGGDWRQADGELYTVENGPSIDRFARVISGTSYGWTGNNNDMLINAIYNWNPAHAPVDMAFTQSGIFNGSGFPADKMDHAFASESGPTWASGPQARGKRIVEFVVDGSGNLTSGPTTLVEYNGSGKATAAGMAAGPDGLYFTDLYKDQNYVTPIDAGANILRIRFLGLADFVGAPRLSPAPPLTVVFTDTSNVPNPTSWYWEFGDGSSSSLQNPTHTYTQTGAFDVRLLVTGADGVSIEEKQGYVLVGNYGNGVGLLGQYYEFNTGSPPANPFEVFMLDRIDATVGFDWAGGSPDASIRNDDFAVRWTGQVEPLYSDDYTFYTFSDDGMRIYVDGQLVVADWSNHAARFSSGTAPLIAGQWHDIEVHYYERGGDAVAQVWWSSPNQAMEIIPQSALFPPADLEVAKSAATAVVDIGEFITYTVTITNHGPYSATGTFFTDTLPAGVSFISGPGCSLTNGIVRCNMADLQQNEAATAVFTAHVPLTAGSPIVNTAHGDSDLFDHLLSNNTGVVTTAVTAAAPPHIYVASTLAACNNASPCTDDVQAAFATVADNGRITILDNYTVADGLTSGNNGSYNVLVDGPGTLTWDSGVGGTLFTVITGNVTFDEVSMEAIAPGTAVSLSGSGSMTIQNTAGVIMGFDTAVAVTGSGTAVVKGSNFQANLTAFSQSSGTLIAYANNIVGSTMAVSSSGGSQNVGHNWWGSYSDPAPPGVDAAAWAARLGATVADWAEGSGAAVLGNAQLSGGGGTAVIVSHGRTNWPFGNGVSGHADDMCSDYYDFFTVNGTGIWTATVPVDNNAACSASTLTPQRIFWISDIADCDTPTNGACWDLILSNVAVNGQYLEVTNLSVADLGGTPFVAGSSSGNSPTAVTLRSFSTAGSDNQMYLLFLIGLTLISGTVITLRRRQR